MSQEETLVPSDTADPSVPDEGAEPSTDLTDSTAYDDTPDGMFTPDMPDGFDAEEADENDVPPEDEPPVDQYDPVADFRDRFDGSFGMALIALEAGHPVTNELLGNNRFLQFLPGYRRPGKRINSVVPVETPICTVEFIPGQEHPTVSPWLNIPQAALLSRGWRIMD